jgi:hypothetical protein
MAVAKKSAFSSNGRNGHDEPPKSLKVRTAFHDDVKSMRDSAKQMPNVRLTFKEGEARTVRFLHEPFNKRNPWVEYQEHYVPGSGGGNGAYVPCIEDCRLDGDIRAGKRWYVNVWDRDSKQVRLLKLTGAMIENLIIKYERRGTIMDRDYSITRTGEGTDTKYHIEAEEKEAFDQRNIKLIDIIQYLDQQAQSYYGGVKSTKARASSIDDDEDEDDVEDVEDDEEDEDEEPSPRKKPVAKKATSRRAPVDEDEDDEEEDEPDEEDEEEDEEEERPAKRKPAVAKGRKAAAVEEDEDEDEDEPDEEDEEDEDEEEEAPRRKTSKVPARGTATKRPLGRGR